MKKTQISFLFALVIPILFAITLPFVGLSPISTNEYVYNRIIFGVLGTLYSFLLTYLFLLIDGKRFKDVGLYWEKKTLMRFVKGISIGFLIAGTMLLIIIKGTNIAVVRNEEIDLLKALIGLLAFFPLAFMEEIIYRGAPFLSIKKIYGIRAAQVITAVLFAYYHDCTGATFISQLMGPGIWAITYGYFALKSGGIALPTGVHCAANIVLALLGTKHEDYAVWTMIEDPSVANSSPFLNENLGIIIQLALLVFGVYLTERYIRNKKDHFKTNL